VIVNFLLAGHFLHALGPALPASSPLSSPPLGPVLVRDGALLGGEPAVGEPSAFGGAVAVGGAVVLRLGGAASTGNDVTHIASIENTLTKVRRNSVR
jgi:hypothetical protein